MCVVKLAAIRKEEAREDWTGQVLSPGGRLEGSKVMTLEIRQTTGVKYTFKHTRAQTQWCTVRAKLGRRLMNK